MANHQISCIWQVTAAAITVAAAIVSQSVMASPSPPACMPVSGLLEAMESTKVRFVVFGEVHGTSEIPDFFADAVCQLSESRPILGLLEFDRHDGHVIDRYVHGDPGITASVLGTAGDWAARVKDGRTNKAMFSMIGRLRQLAVAGRQVAVEGVVPRDNFKLPQSYYELGIANAMRRAAAAESSLTQELMKGTTASFR
jgi:hypothetical protein